MNNTLKITHWFAGAALAFSLAGCASVSVKNVDTANTPFPPTGKPDVIYIMPFDVSSGEFNVDRQGAELADFKQNLQQMMSAALTAEIPEHLVPAQAVNAVPGPGNAWLVSGRFVRVNQGSRLLTWPITRPRRS